MPRSGAYPPNQALGLPAGPLFGRGQGAVQPSQILEEEEPILHRNGSPVCAYAFSSAAAKAQFDQAADAGVTTGLNSLPDGRICYGQ